MPTKERTKENCRCCDAADPRLGGCTPPRPPKRKSQGHLATRTQYYCSRLTPTGLAPLLSRGFPRTSAVGNGMSVGAGLCSARAVREGCRLPLPLSLFLYCSVGRPVLRPPHCAFRTPLSFSCRGGGVLDAPQPRHNHPPKKSRRGVHLGGTVYLLLKITHTAGTSRSNRQRAWQCRPSWRQSQRCSRRCSRR